jgi:hypothetical protein
MNVKIMWVLKPPGQSTAGAPNRGVEKRQFIIFVSEGPSPQLSEADLGALLLLLGTGRVPDNHPRLSQTSNLPIPLRFFVPRTIRETFLRLPRHSVPAAVLRQVMRSPSRRSRASLLEPEPHHLNRVMM